MTSQPNDLTSLKTVLYDAQSTTDTDSSVYYSLDSSHDLKRPAETSESPPPAKMDTLEKARKEFRITPPDWKNHMGAWAYLQSLAPQHRSMYLEKTQTDQRQRIKTDLLHVTYILASFDDERISKTHCLIYMEAGSNSVAKGIRIFLKDLSSNGTFVNKKKIDRDQRCLLRSGDIIQLYRSNKLADDDYKHAFYRILFPGAYDVNACTDDYDVKQFLGKGTFASVYSAREIATGKLVAVKIIDKARFARNKRLSKTINDETIVMMAIERHPCAVGINYVYNEERLIYLIMDYVKDGELFNFVVDRKKLTEDETRFIFWQLFKTIQWLHNKQITHRDLKPENILLESKDKLHVKITDFGLAKILAKGERLDSQCGTPNYIAPEILDPLGERSYGLECDMWSLGVMLFICLCGYPPFSESAEGIPMKTQIKQGIYSFASPYWDDISSEAIDLIRRLLTVNPLDRARSAEALPEYMQAKFEALGKETVELIESRSHTENVPDTQAIASLEGSLPSYQ
ncbi:hypothetical protein G6F37_006644 [Rhizopus arrhizus]|nr:hypothetical protein G6F38_003807 [Rhizopus arrhizus]KAG1157505.1 hypothetical protein G6F37_006644 [Rhizopus arrhizus]